MNREAGVSGGGDELLDTRRGDIRVDSDQGVQWQSDGFSLGFLEREGTGEQLVLVGFEESFFAGLPDQRGDGVAVGDFADFARGRDAHQLQHSGRHCSQADDDRAEYPHEQQQRRGEHHRGPFRSRQGEILRHHFTEQHVQAGHQGERDRERQWVDEFMRDMERC